MAGFFALKIVGRSPGFTGRPSRRSVPLYQPWLTGESTKPVFLVCNPLRPNHLPESKSTVLLPLSSCRAGRFRERSGQMSCSRYEDCTFEYLPNLPLELAMLLSRPPGKPARRWQIFSHTQKPQHACVVRAFPQYMNADAVRRS